MRGFIKLSLAAIVVFGLAVQAFAAVDPADIVGIWTFDEGDGEDTEDGSGNGHDGELVGNAEWVDEGKFGKAIEFDAGHVKIEHDDDMSLETFSMTAWVKVPGPIATFQMVISKQSWPDRNYSMWILPDRINVGITSGAADSQTQGGVVADDQWHHVASTYNKEFLRTYVDGAKTSEIGLSSTPNICTAPLMIAAEPPGGGNPTYGIIDEVGVFRVGLEEGDVQDIMQGGLSMFMTAVEPGSKLCTVWGALKDIY